MIFALSRGDSRALEVIRMIHRKEDTRVLNSQEILLLELLWTSHGTLDVIARLLVDIGRLEYCLHGHFSS